MESEQRLEELSYDDLLKEARRMKGGILAGNEAEKIPPNHKKKGDLPMEDDRRHRSTEDAPPRNPEFYEAESEIGLAEAWAANMKRMYDEYQHESLESIRRNRTYVDKVVSDAQQHDNVRQDIANQALQNAVTLANKVANNSAETDNMVAKQAVRHSDLSIDRQWNIDEQGYTAEGIITALKSDSTVQVALKDVLAQILANMAVQKA